METNTTINGGWCNYETWMSALLISDHLDFDELASLATDSNSETGRRLRDHIEERIEQDLSDGGYDGGGFYSPFLMRAIRAGLGCVDWDALGAKVRKDAGAQLVAA